MIEADLADAPPFLARLGLDTRADTRVVRRAYAREVKQIDQEQDAQGFQDLREAYEIALRWCERRAAQAAADAQAALDADAAPAADTVPPAAPAPPPPAAVSTQAAPHAPPAVPAQAAPHAPPAVPAQDTAPPAAAAAAPVPTAVEPPPAVPGPALDAHDPAPACDALVRSIIELNKAAPDEQDPVENWRAALRAALQQPCLLNLDAKTRFEYWVAGLLQQWRPGHELLFEAAVEVFGWEHDRRHLLEFGSAGARLDRAIDERLMFDQRLEPDRSNQRRVLRELRAGALPRDYLLKRDLVHLERMVQRYPNLLPIIADLEWLPRWRARYLELESELPDLTPPPPPPSSSGDWDSAKGFGLGGMLLFGLIRVLLMFFNSSHVPVDNRPPPPRYEQHRTASAAGLPALAPELVKAIEAKVRVAMADGEHRRAFCAVTLTATGEVKYVALEESSGSLAFDDAFIMAIRLAGPYPAATPREFSVDLALDGPRSGPPPSVPSRPLPAATGRGIAQRIRFHVPPWGVPKRLMTEYEVTADERGSLHATRLLHASGDPAYDSAVRFAIENTTPVGAGYAGKSALKFWVDPQRPMGDQVPLPVRQGGPAAADDAAGPGAVTAPRAPWPPSSDADVDLPAAERARVAGKIKFPPVRATPSIGRGKFAVVLDDDGMVKDVWLLESSGDNLFDLAVGTAIRAAAPFPARTARRFTTFWDVPVK